MRARSILFFLLGLALWGAGLGVVWIVHDWSRWFPSEGEQLRLDFAEARDSERHADALALLDHLAAREGDGGWLGLDRAELLLALGRPAEAVAEVRKAIDHEGGVGAYHFDRLAAAQTALGDRDGAIQSLLRAIGLDAQRYDNDRRFLAELLARAQRAGASGTPGGEDWWQISQTLRLVTSADGRAACEPDERLVGGGCGRDGWLLACPVPLAVDWPTAPGDLHRQPGGAQSCGGARGLEAWALCAGGAPGPAEAPEPGQDPGPAR